MSRPAQPAPSAFSLAAPSALSRAAVEVEYPSSDGKPLAENDAQLAAILYGVGALRVHYAGRSVRIPAQSDHRIRSKVISDSGGK